MEIIKTISIKLEQPSVDELEWLLANTHFTSKAQIVRSGIHNVYKKNSGDYHNKKTTRKSSNDANQSEVDKLRQEREAKAAKRQAEIELLKEEKSDILDDIDNYEVSEDSEHNAWLHWQYFQKRGGELQSWRADYRLDRIHDDLATLPQYQPDKSSIMNLLENGGNVILHNKHEDYDTIPEDIKPYLN